MYQSIILGCVLLVTFHILKSLRDPMKTVPNTPPLVSYKIPVIGHTFSYWFNCSEFLKQCKKDYGDIFCVYIWGRVRIFVGKEHAQEILTKDDSFNFNLALRNILPADEMFVNTVKDPIRLLKDRILIRLESYSERIQKGLDLSTKRCIGDCDEPKTIYQMYYVMTKIISAPIANILIGEEEAQHDDVLTAFAKFTSDAAIFFMIPPFLDFIYPGLQSYVNGIPVKLGLYDPVKKHRSVLTKHVKYQVEKRLREKEKYGDSWNRPDDLLQYFIEEGGADFSDKYYGILSDKLSFFIFASVHTTSRGCTNVVMDLASRPEYMQELYEEQLEIHKTADENGILPYEALNKMKKLDNFIRESFRLTGHIATLPHVVTKNYTFSNGMQLPKGCTAEIFSQDVYDDELLQGPNPKLFDPSRHENKNVSPAKIDKSYLLFGGGKHACPGRYLAVNEIKYFMHNVILKYNLRTESGKIEDRVVRGPLAFPSPNGIIFEKRIKNEF